MGGAARSLAALREENAALREENAALRSRLAEAEGGEGRSDGGNGEATPERAVSTSGGFTSTHGLSRAQVERYSRQMVLPAVGAAGQARLCAARAAVVGLGGLGSPVALYLAAAGVGHLTLVDGDAVDASNLHRQVIHTEQAARARTNKAASAAASCRALNSTVEVTTIESYLDAASAAALADAHDVVVDCSDNAATRYLLSDACAAGLDHERTPLVSAAAVGTDGQLSVYSASADSPCYRCVHPRAPARAACQSCSDAGVLGPLVGAMGALQALEAVKLCAGIGRSLAGRLVLLDGLDLSIMTVKLRKRSEDCAACGSSPSITRASIQAYDYEGFAGPAHDRGGAPVDAACALGADERISAREFHEDLLGGGGSDGVPVLDVRSAEQFAMASVPGSISIPFEQLAGRCDEAAALVAQSPSPGGRLVVVCRRGNDSQRAVRLLRAAGVAGAVDVRGGLAAYADEVPAAGFPSY